jgi:Uncharacterized conserved protein (some members contain a von Willebrand factor type A (vWA) domain)
MPFGRRRPQSRRPQAAARPLLDAADAAALVHLAHGWRRSGGRRPVERGRQGDDPTRRSGQGLDYAESRLYQPGDDLHDLHWRLYARTGKPHVKRYEEERAPHGQLLIDRAPALAFGTRRRTKAEQIARVALLAAAQHLLAREGAAADLGVTLWRDVPAASHALGAGATAVRRLAALLQGERLEPPPLAAEGGDPAARTAAFARLARGYADELPAGSRLFIVSDLGWWNDDLAPVLYRLASHVRVTILRVLDPVERALPRLAPNPFHDLRHGRTGLLVLDEARRLEDADRRETRLQAQTLRLRAAGAALIEADALREDRDLLQQLLRIP